MSRAVIELLKTIQQEIDEYIEYLVDVEGVELTEMQQKKITEPLDFYQQKIEVDMTSQKLSQPNPHID